MRGPCANFPETMDRRQSLGLLGTLLGALVWSKPAHATTARAVSLQELVQRSSRVARVTALESSARHEDIGNTRHIVTYTRLRIDEGLLGKSDSETWVRTLGGRVGELGEIVHGEAELALNESCLVFLYQHPDGIEQVTAMAQGHYRLALDAAGAQRLAASRNMPHLLGGATLAAAAQLNGLRFSEARDLIMGAHR